MTKEERRIYNNNYKRKLRQSKDYVEKEQAVHRVYMQRLRKSALEILGGKCVRCGFSDERALQIDHINGGGVKEIREHLFKGNYHKYVIESVLSKKVKYQLLCANCNWIKRSENGENRRRN